MVSPAIAAAIITVVFTALAILIGLAYRNLKNRVAALEESDDDISDNHQSLVSKVDTLWRWAFGREDDSTDGGLSREIQDGFDRIEDDITETQKKQETYHEAEMAQLRRLVNRLHDEDSLDFEREDVFKDDDNK